MGHAAKPRPGRRSAPSRRLAGGDLRELHEALQRRRQGLHARVAHLRALVEAQVDPRERERENRIFPFSSLRSPVYPRQLMAAGKYNICTNWKTVTAL